MKNPPKKKPAGKIEKVKKFKVRFTNRLKDPEMKMKITYDVPITHLGVLIDYLEKYRRK